MKLRTAFYSGSTNPKTIIRENIALMSDLNFNYIVLKSVRLQANANGKKKKTFFLRYTHQLSKRILQSKKRCAHFQIRNEWSTQLDPTPT